MNALCAPRSPSTSVSSPSSDLHTPPPSHSSLQVPNVFVTPPEEEHGNNPPFCYYDAASESKQALSVGPDIEAVDVALSFFQQTENRAPTFHRSFANESQETIVMPRRSDDKPVGDLSEQKDKKGEQLKRVVFEDTDVVEVIKVRRSEGLHYEEEYGHPLKKSKTFRQRASQAFKSIRNLNRAGRNSKGPVVDQNNENAHMDTVTEDGMRSSRSSTPNLQRRKSIQLPQLFTTSRSGRVSTSDVSPPLTPSGWSTLSRPSLTLGDRTNASSPSPSLPQDSQHPMLSTKRSFRHRMSVVNLRRVFSPAAEEMPPQSNFTPALRSGGTLPRSVSTSTQSSKGSSLSRSRSSSSVNMLRGLSDVFSSSSSSSVNVSLQTSQSSSVPTSLSARPMLADDDIDMDENLELRLDSLHFDSLHFDPGEFDLGNL